MASARIKPRSLSLITFNANGLTRQIDLVRDFLRNHPVDIMLVQETFLKPGLRNPNIANYRILRNDRVTAKGGTVIYYKKSLHCVPLANPPLTNIEASICQLSMTGHQPVILASVYLSPNNQLLESDIRSLLSIGSAVILAGDLNSKHPSWNSRKSNAKGIFLDRLTHRMSLNFSVIAPTTYTRFPLSDNRKDSPDVLDIAILKGVTLQLRSIESLSELDSDHRPVMVELGPDDRLHYPTKTIVDWIKLKEHLHSLDPQSLKDIPDRIDSVDAAKAAAIKLTSHLRDKLDECSREVQNRPNERWELPGDLKDLITRKNAATRRHDAFPSKENRKHLRALQRDVKARFDAFRDDNYGRRLGEIKPSHTAFWSMPRSLKGNSSYTTMPPLLRPNLTPAIDDLDKAECLADSLESQCSPSSQPVDADHLLKVDAVVDYISSVPPMDDPLPPTSVEEIETIIKALQVKKSPGLDRIPNKAIKSLPRQLIALLVVIFNALLAGCSFPDQWKEAIVIGIPKPGKPKNQPSSYRPISLLNTLAKIYERVIHARLKAFVEANHILINEQFGFRPGHSCVNQVHRLTEDILRGFAISKATSTGALFFDVAKAFDKVWHNGLLYKLYLLGLPDSLILIIRDYLSNRTFRYRVEGTLSSPRPIRAGVPQGSVLSPILYSLFTNDIPNTTNRVKLALFADDTALYSTTPSTSIMTKRLQTAANALGAWFRKWRIEVNPEKSVAVHFTRHPKSIRWRQGKPGDIKLYGQNIDWKPEVKYLGVTLDSKLTFRSHIARVRNRAAFALGRLYVMLCGRSKMSLRNKTTLYKTFIRPIMTYASPVFSHSRPALIARLQRIQNKFLRIATNSPWYIRNVDLHRDLDIESIAKHLKMLATSYFEKAKQHGNPLIAQACSYNSLRGNFPDRLRRPMHVLTDKDDDITVANPPTARKTRYKTHLHRYRRRNRGPSLVTPHRQT